jgi:radical SAM enzyme (TIGR01210 family)
MMRWFPVTDRQILAARGPRNPVDPWRPWSFLVEPEFSASGRVEDVATVFLTNRECSFRCVMCDLWKYTTEVTVPDAAIPAQIDYALSRLAPAQHIKLYNSGNFFDARSIPRAAWPLIAQRVSSFRTVIVENHPRLCGPDCAEFQQLCGTQLEVALGLETSNSDTLATLNKHMTTDDFERACRTLLREGIRVRAFILLRPPGISEEQGVEQALNSVRFALDCGVSCCSVIPARPGNGLLDQWLSQGLFERPGLRSLERVLEDTLSWKRGRVFADLWEIDQSPACAACRDRRVQRLLTANLTQQMPPAVLCADCVSCCVTS